MAQNIALSDNIEEYLLDAFGKDFLENYRNYIQSDANTYIRISTADGNDEAIVESLKQYGIELEALPNIPFGYRVLNGFEYIGKTLEFTLGKYYIQSLSSMIPPLILQPDSEDTVLDLCAAPGSKSSQLAEMMENKGTLYVNEPNINRIKSLVFNFDKMNFVNFGAIKYKGELLSKVFENTFDKILVDAPCSGLGILQKKGEVSNWWSLQQAEKIAELQFRLLLSALKMLKPGGEMIYSTCTLTVEENEVTLNKILRKYPVEIKEIELPVKSHPAFTSYNGEELNPEIAKAHRIIPWEVNSEGFFICKLRKTGETEPTRKADYKKRNIELLSAKSKDMKKYLEQISSYFGIPLEILQGFKYIRKGNDFNFVDKDWYSDNYDLFLRIGRKFGLVDKRDYAHLNSYAIQVLAPYITKNIIELDNPDDLRKYIDGGIIKKQFEPYGQKIVKYNNLFFGTAIAFKDGLKSQFPRALRTSEIITPEEANK
ncbi:MAG: NOL1/NOP2/sun family putative RNA methylase [Rhodothermaceae bacterium]